MDKEAQKRRKLGPNYSQIYKDLINQKYPEKAGELKKILDKQMLSFFEIQSINQQLFGVKEKSKLFQEQRYRAYNKQTIRKILAYKKEHQLNNTQVANHFKLSRNTVAKWIKIFEDQV